MKSTYLSIRTTSWFNHMQLSWAGKNISRTSPALRLPCSMWLANSSNVYIKQDSIMLACRNQLEQDYAIAANQYYICSYVLTWTYTHNVHNVPTQYMDAYLPAAADASLQSSHTHLHCHLGLVVHQLWCKSI